MSPGFYGIPEKSSVEDKNKERRRRDKFSSTLKLAILIHPFGRFGGAERLAILHAVGLTGAGHEVTMYTDATLMDPVWLSMLAPRVQVRELPYGLKGGDVIQELNNFDKLIIHH